MTATRAKKCSNDFLPKRRQNQFDRQLARLIKRIKEWIDLGDLDRQDPARIRKLLHCQVRLSVRRAAALRSANTRRIEGIEKVHVHRHMKPGCIARGYCGCLLDYLRNAALVDFAHRIDSDPEFFDSLALARIDAAGADHYRVLR